MVNVFDNLLLLCLFHAAQIDDDETWQDYPIELLTEWKSQQVLHADLLGSAPAPTDAEVDELLVMSRERDPITRSVTIDLARAVRRLRSAAERTRVEPAGIMRERQHSIDQLNRGSIAYDSETGERLHLSLSRQEERVYTTRIHEALARTQGDVDHAADAVLEHAAGVAAAVGSAADDARAWVERAVAEAVRAAGEWADDVPHTLSEVDAAAAALRDVAAGRAVSVPSPTPPPEPEPPSPVDLFFARWTEVAERAARHMRVDHLPYDESLYTEVISFAADCAAVPKGVSLLPYGIERNAALAAALLKNATDEEFASGLDTAAMLQPESAAAYHLRHLHRLADKRGWTDRIERLETALGQLGASLTTALAAREFWERNIEHGVLVLLAANDAVGDEAVANALRTTLNDPALTEPIVIALSETVEERDSSTWELTGIRRRYSEPNTPIEALPDFIPIDAICTAIAAHWPDGPRRSGSEVERLAAEFRDHRCSR